MSSQFVREAAKTLAAGQPRPAKIRPAGHFSCANTYHRHLYQIAHLFVKQNRRAPTCNPRQSGKRATWAMPFVLSARLPGCV